MPFYIENGEQHNFQIKQDNFTILYFLFRIRQLYISIPLIQIVNRNINPKIKPIVWTYSVQIVVLPNLANHYRVSFKKIVTEQLAGINFFWL